MSAPTPRIVFFGNHTVGVRTLEVLRNLAEVTGVVCHPPDPEDGVAYESVHRFAVTHGLAAIRATGREPTLANWVGQHRPDLIWVADYRYLLPPEIIGLARLAAVNMHPSLLPRYRGRAPINWAILHGETELGLTVHLIDDGMDTGNILAQARFSLSAEEDVADALNKLYPLYQRLTRQVLDQIANGDVTGRPQEHSQASVFPRRRPEDGAIDWSADAVSIQNLVRAVAPPYPGAFSFIGRRRLMVLRATLAGAGATESQPQPQPPGTVVEATSERLVVRCGGGGLLAITRWQLDDDEALCPGDILGR